MVLVLNARVIFRHIIIIVAIILLSFAIAYNVQIPNQGYGDTIRKVWFNVTQASVDIDNPSVEFRQFISLASFLFVVLFTIISIKLRSFASFAGICLLVFFGVIAPQHLIHGVEWSLILFLIGSMTFAFILRSIGVFEYLGFKLLELSHKYRFSVLLMIAVLSWFLAMILDEVTSIVYVLMLILDIKKLTGYDIKPLIVVSVLATNTGSLALPLGNPIGIYLSYTVKLTVNEFILRALPLSTLALSLLLLLSYVLLRKYIESLTLHISSDKFMRKVHLYYIEKTSRDPQYVKLVKIGLILIFCFLQTILLNEYLSEALSTIAASKVDPHYTLTFIPYLYIVLLGVIYGPKKLEKAVETGVDWPSILFFISLFMLGYSLLHTGVSIKLAYLAYAYFNNSTTLLSYSLILISGGLSSILDNLSVVVALSSIAKVMVAVSSSKNFYWAILYGGVLGGNFTPIGSTANIVAVSLASREKIKIDWFYWLKIATPLASAQIILSLIYVSLI